MNTSDEIHLIKKLINNDEKAFEALFHLHSQKIYAFAVRILKSPALADDVVQDTFITLWEKSGQLNTEFSFQSYLFSIARNKSLNILKKASKETGLSDEIIAYAKASTADGEALIELHQTQEYLKLAIDQLPPKRRLIYDLCKNDGHSYKEAAHKLGITDSTVNSQMVKALKFIKHFMIQQGALMGTLVLKAGLIFCHLL